MLHYAGIGLFAEVPRIDEDWPRVGDSRNAVVVLSMRRCPTCRRRKSFTH